MCRAARSLPQRRAWIALLVLALMLAQALGVAHRIVHSPVVLLDDPARTASSLDSSRLDASTIAAGPASSALSWAKALFGHAGGDHACHLYDQLSHADLLLPAVPQIDVAPPAPACVPIHPAWHLAAQAIGFLARGPPHTS